MKDGAKAEAMVVGEAPGFESFEKQDFHLAATSPCLGAGVPLAPELLQLRRKLSSASAAAATPIIASG